MLDAWSRRIAGWPFRHDRKTRLVLDALDMVVASRKPKDAYIIAIRGCSVLHGRSGTAAAPPASVRRNRKRCPRMAADRTAPLRDEGRSPDRGVPVHRGFYNTSRRHSSIDYLSSAEVEAAHQANRAPTARPNSKPVRGSESTPTPDHAFALGPPGVGCTFPIPYGPRFLFPCRPRVFEAAATVVATRRACSSARASLPGGNPVGAGT